MIRGWLALKPPFTFHYDRPASSAIFLASKIQIRISSAISFSFESVWAKTLCGKSSTAFRCGESEETLKSQYRQNLIASLLSMLTIAAPIPALAVLGGDVSSVQADQAQMKAVLRIQTAQSYTVHELHEQSGMVVKEFISPAGKVFAVSWGGPFVP